MIDERRSGEVAPALAVETSPPDRIFLRDHVRDIEIGAYPNEIGVTQRVRFNVTLDVRRTPPFDADDEDRVASYDMIVKAIDRLAAGPRMALLETCAERVAQACLADARVSRAHVIVEKLDRVSGGLGVEIVRLKPRDI